MGTGSVDDSGVMPWGPNTLGQISDGQAAWDEFVSGVQRTFENNAGMVPTLAIVLVVVIVLWLDFRVAKLLVGRGGKRRVSKGDGSRSS